MKNIILTIIVMIYAMSIFAQDKEPEPFNFTYSYIDENDTIVYDDEPFDPDDFKQKNFKSLWMWSTHYKVSRATKSDGFGLVVLWQKILNQMRNLLKVILFLQW